MKIFIAGSITIKHLDLKVQERIDNILAQNFEILVGDAEGVDLSIQSYLCSQGTTRVTVYCSGETPRNNIGNWPVHSVKTSYAAGTRAFYTAKDIRMAELADIGLMIWDTKSAGTLSNILELLSHQKKSVVFINTAKTFLNIASVAQLDSLLSHMPEKAKQKASIKIGLHDKIDAMKREQLQIFA